MKPFRSAAALAAWLSLAVPAAQAQEAPSRPAERSPTLEGLTVAPSPPPAVVGSVPAAGAKVDAGVTILKLTFDQSMDPDSWGYAKGPGDDYPDCLAKPRLLDGARTFVLLCTTAPGKAYTVRINDGAEGGFANPGGRRATPFELHFSTGAGTVVSLKDALKVAGLRDEDGPILDAVPARR